MAKKNVRDDHLKNTNHREPADERHRAGFRQDGTAHSSGIRNQQERQVFHRAGRQRALELLSQD